MGSLIRDTLFPLKRPLKQNSLWIGRTSACLLSLLTEFKLRCYQRQFFQFKRTPHKCFPCAFLSVLTTHTHTHTHLRSFTVLVLSLYAISPSLVPFLLLVPPLPSLHPNHVPTLLALMLFGLFIFYFMVTHWVGILRSPEVSFFTFP